MIHYVKKSACLSALAVMVWMIDMDMGLDRDAAVIQYAEAVIGRPVTPVSYAGVARRSTVGAGAPGVGVRPRAGVGGPASGVGVLPGAGAGRVGVGRNAGGPVNRVGRR
ncbi:MAG: hypothetical protein P8Y83_10205 [Gammaproteobacteria bacterium]|jgi:hypothetical protein